MSSVRAVVILHRFLSAHSLQQSLGKAKKIPDRKRNAAGLRLLSSPALDLQSSSVTTDNHHEPFLFFLTSGGNTHFYNQTDKSPGEA